MLSNHHEKRTYPPQDSADSANCKPDFAVLIYPAYLTAGDKKEAIAPELPVSAGRTPPTFIAMAEDDPIGVQNALCYYSALSQAKVPSEMHLYPTGGHGYGLRRTAAAVTSWPDRVADWLRTDGWLKASPKAEARPNP